MVISLAIEWAGYSEGALPDPGSLPGRSDAEIEAAALSDPDNPPRTPEREKKLKRVPHPGKEDGSQY